jgi:hypothetical protein
MTTINDINHAIMFNDFTNDQLDSITMAIKYRRNELAKKARYSVSIGSKVRFVSSRNGKTVIGTVAKINRKTIIVCEQNAISSYGTRWRVPASMIEVVSTG